MLPESVSIIIMASAQWETHTPVNVHQIARRFAQRGHRVLFVESTGLRAPSVRSGRDWEKVGRRLKGWRDGPRAVAENLWTLAPISLPMRGPRPLRAWAMRTVGRAVQHAARSLGFEGPLLWCFLPTYVLAAPYIKHTRLIYHCVDHYAANPGVDRSWIERIERQMLEHADLVITTSDVLAERLARDRDEVLCLPNVADVERFSTALTGDLPAPDDLRDIPRPRLIYVGNLAGYRIDFDLFVEILTKRREWNLVSLGVVGHGDVTATTASRVLPSLDNVHLLGPRPQAELPSYLAHADIAIIPFLDNEHTRGSLPLKLWEYIAAGVPVVATDLPNFHEPARQGLVRTARTVEQWTHAIEASLAEPPDERHRRAAAAQSHGWPARIDKLSELLGEVSDRH